jgi:hypothetical protein
MLRATGSSLYLSRWGGGGLFTVYALVLMVVVWLFDIFTQPLPIIIILYMYTPFPRSEVSQGFSSILQLTNNDMLSPMLEI